MSDWRGSGTSLWGGLMPEPDTSLYDSADWWGGEIGRNYESLCDRERYEEQEEVLSNSLSQLEWGTVLDVGCGFGRLIPVLERINPDTVYTGLDVSESQLAAAKRHYPDHEYIHSPILTFEPGDRKWDLVVSTEVLMHQTDNQIEKVVASLLRWSGHWVLSCDWTPLDGNPGNEWNRPHDYAALYGGGLVRSFPVGKIFPWSDQSVFLSSVRV